MRITLTGTYILGQLEFKWEADLVHDAGEWECIDITITLDGRDVEAEEIFYRLTAVNLADPPKFKTLRDRCVEDAEEAAYECGAEEWAAGRADWEYEDKRDRAMGL